MEKSSPLNVVGDRLLLSPSVAVYSGFFSRAWSEDHFLELLRVLPESLQQQVTRFRRWQDCQCALLGKLLLRDALQQAGYDLQLLQRICYSDHGRPYIVGVADFNISHSHQGVVCALGQQTVLGVDIERRRSLQPRDFTLCMNSRQIDELESQSQPDVALLDLWVEKESVAKAHGVGMSYDFRRLEADRGIYRIEQVDYHIHHLRLHEDYHCCLATDVRGVDIDIKAPRLE